MTAVIIYTALVIFSYAWLVPKILEDIKYKGGHCSKSTPGSFLSGLWIVVPLYAWVIFSVGWAWPTILMVLWTAFNYGLGLVDIDRYGGIKYTLRGTAISFLVNATVIYGLFSLVS